MRTVLFAAVLAVGLGGAAGCSSDTKPADGKQVTGPPPADSGTDENAGAKSKGRLPAQK